MKDFEKKPLHYNSITVLSFSLRASSLLR